MRLKGVARVKVGRGMELQLLALTRTMENMQHPKAQQRHQKMHLKGDAHVKCRRGTERQLLASAKLNHQMRCLSKSAKRADEVQLQLGVSQICGNSKRHKWGSDAPSFVRGPHI